MARNRTDRGRAEFLERKRCLMGTWCDGNAAEREAWVKSLEWGLVSPKLIAALEQYLLVAACFESRLDLLDSACTHDYC